MPFSTSEWCIHVAYWNLLLLLWEPFKYEFMNVDGLEWFGAHDIYHNQSDISLWDWPCLRSALNEADLPLGAATQEFCFKLRYHKSPVLALSWTPQYCSSLFFRVAHLRLPPKRGMTAAELFQNEKHMQEMLRHHIHRPKGKSSHCAVGVLVVTQCLDLLEILENNYTVLQIGYFKNWSSGLLKSQNMPRV